MSDASDASGATFTMNELCCLVGVQPETGVTSVTSVTGPVRELTRDEEAAERGARVRACLCATWELRALGRCVCPEARGEDEDAVNGQLGGKDARRPARHSVGRSEAQGSRACDSATFCSQFLTYRSTDNGSQTHEAAR